MFKTYSLNRLLVLLASVGFSFLTIDTIIEHWGIFSQEVLAFVPVTFGIIGTIIGAMAALRWDERWIRRFHLLLLTSLVIGIAGLYFHIESFEDKPGTAEEREHESKEKEKPLLAPLAFAGLAMFGLLGTSRRWHAEVKPSE